MDCISFQKVGSSALLENGKIINGIDTKTWVERYREPGDFKFVGKVSTGLRELLPIGSFVSHVDTSEVMIVENHEIDDDGKEDPDIVVSGRGFESFFEARGVAITPNGTSSTGDYLLAQNRTWVQATILIRDHILPGWVYDPDDEISNLEVKSTVTGNDGEYMPREISMGDLHSKLTDLLAIDHLGIKFIRPGFPGGSAFGNFSSLVIHRGTDRTSQVGFYKGLDEFESADYLWTDKNYFNAAIVKGKHIQVTVDTTAAGMDRRVMTLSGTEIEGKYDDPPTSAQRTAIQAEMYVFGLKELAKKNKIAFIKPNISKRGTKHKYRVNYDLGDLVTVHGGYSEAVTMRVMEYAEFEDENGLTGYPTLGEP